MLADFEKEADTRVGWAKPGMMGPGTRVATAESIKSEGFRADPWNPLWRIEKYAVATRWGGIIAHPWYLESFKPPESMLKVPPGGGFLTFLLMGHDCEIFQPIRPNDVIRAWARRPKLEDVTSLDGKGLRKFHYIDVDADLINQRDELISTIKQYVEITMHPKRPPKAPFVPEYGYTLQEFDYLESLVKQEEVRGEKIRYWEDVKVGDEPKPLVLGPVSLTVMGGMPGFSMGGPDEVPPRTFEKYVEPTGAPIMFGYVPDPDTGLIYLSHGGRHSSDRAAQYDGEPRAFLFARESRASMTRLVTNWMGDDGFIRKYEWRHIYRSPVGDCLINHGKVVKKYVENGEHLVDVKAWCENLRGTITEVSIATVKLLSKNDPYPDVKKVVRC